MSTNESRTALSRRTALAGLGAGGLGLALTVPGRPAAAQDAASDLASHPMVGTWAANTGDGIVPQIHGADGSMIAAFTPNYVDPALGLTFQGPALGQWEADGERTGRFTFLQALSDASGAYVGTFQVTGNIEVSEDGQTWVGGTEPTRVIMRDATNTVILDQEIPGSPRTPLVTATRIGATAESVVLPVMTPTAATPTT